MKKKDIIQLVKNTINEVGADAYGSATNLTKGLNVAKSRFTKTGRPPGVWEGESTSFKVVNADTGKTIDFGLDQAKAEEIVALAKEDNINAKIVKMKDADDVGKLNEFTSMGQEGIYPRKEEPGDMFQQKEVEELLPNGMASRDDREFQARLKQHADWTEESGYNNTFVHIQYHDSFDREHSYRIHQSQNYNGNYKDFRNPKFTVLTITKKKEGKEEELGKYIVDTDAYLKDFAKLRNDGVLGKQVSEDYKPSHRAYDVIDKSKNDEIVFKKLSRDRALEKAHKNPNYMIVATDKLANENKELTDNPKLQPGKTVTYSGTRYKVIENSGYVLTLKSLESGNELKLNLGQLRDRPIKENNMAKNKKRNLKKEDVGMFITDKDGKKYVKMTDKDFATSKDDMMQDSDILQIQTSKGQKVKGEGLEEEPSEGNAFGKAMQDTPKGEKVKVGDQEFTKSEMHTNDMGKDKFVDDEGRHAKMQLQKAAEYSVKLAQMMDDMTQLPSWVQSKITKASDYMSAVYHYLDYEMQGSNEDLMENMDKHRKRARLMEGATEILYKRFAKGDSNEDIRNDYLSQNIDMPESFIEKLRGNYKDYEDFIHQKKQLEREAENLKSVRSTNNAATGMEGGEVGMEETKTLASGLFKK